MGSEGACDLFCSAWVQNVHVTYFALHGFSLLSSFLLHFTSNLFACFVVDVLLYLSVEECSYQVRVLHSLAPCFMVLTAFEYF